MQIFRLRKVVEVLGLDTLLQLSYGANNRGFTKLAIQYLYF